MILFVDGSTLMLQVHMAGLTGKRTQSWIEGAGRSADATWSTEESERGRPNYQSSRLLIFGGATSGGVL